MTTQEWTPPNDIQWTSTQRLWHRRDVGDHYWELVKNWKNTGIIVKDFTKYPDCEIFSWKDIDHIFGAEPPLPPNTYVKPHKY